MAVSVQSASRVPGGSAKSAGFWRAAATIVGLVALGACQTPPPPPPPGPLLPPSQAGALLGHWAGGEIGARLTPSDRRVLAVRTSEVLRFAPSGSERDWRNPETGHHGVIRARTRYTVEGQTCRDFEQVARVGDVTDVAAGTACAGPDGAWRVLS